jgi:hypothetical protein
VCVARKKIDNCRFISFDDSVTLVAKENYVLKRRMNVIVRGAEEINLDWKAEGYMKIHKKSLIL